MADVELIPVETYQVKFRNHWIGDVYKVQDVPELWQSRTAWSNLLQYDASVTREDAVLHLRRTHYDVLTGHTHCELCRIHDQAPDPGGRLIVFSRGGDRADL